MAKKHYLTATLPDGYVKTIGPTAADYTHYWRIVARLDNGKTEVFWGHTKSLPEAKKKRNAAVDASRNRGWISHEFDIVALVKTAG
ncbi:hypothetical protein [Sphingobium boeckii]|uniref:Uncharacterized protein n=1 Tax=Sphingobium boeckii TaxID=1082345 RepID=A0A7W9AH58_9SPHN|nr:hypothetical protein [Sphingobium boeckii]MBB5685374.1 hypothetical protein [Sphingobium boeckii]